MHTHTHTHTHKDIKLQHDTARMVYGNFHSGEFNTRKCRAVCRFLLRLLRHRNKTLKQAARLILSQRMFTVQLRHFKGWELLRNGTRIQLADLGSKLRDLYVRDKLKERLGSFHPPMIAGHTCRQDFVLPHPPGCDWKEQEQEEVYIHIIA